MRAVDGRRSVERFLRAHPVAAPVEVFAIGKAAASMAHGARAVLGHGIESLFIVTKIGHRDDSLDDAGVVQVESPHPLPDGRSVEHGRELMRRVGGVSPGAYPLFLVSGGSSSLVEAPRDGVTLDDIQSLNRRGLAAGWDIATLNAERVKLSQLKGGGIARLLDGRRALALFISDVPGDDPDVIGSGLLGRAEGRADAIGRHVVACVEDAVRAVVAAGAARGLALEAGAHRFEGEAADVARRFVDALRTTDADGLVWGGESTVTLPARTGRGGRNMHLALAAARLLKPGEPLMMLAAGTDGTDGPTEDAGAIIDAGTIERAELAGVDVERAIRDFDSGTALEGAGDLVHTGPTGTNVGDILIGLRRSGTSVRDAPAGRVL